MELVTHKNCNRQTRTNGACDLLYNSFMKCRLHGLQNAQHFGRKKVPTIMETRGKTLERKGQIDYHKKITNKEDRDRDVDMQLTKERLQFLMLRHFSNFMRQVFLSISSCRPDSMDIQIFKQNNHSLD